MPQKLKENVYAVCILCKCVLLCILHFVETNVCTIVHVSVPIYILSQLSMCVIVCSLLYLCSCVLTSYCIFTQCVCIILLKLPQSIYLCVLQILHMCVCSSTCALCQSETTICTLQFTLPDSLSCDWKSCNRFQF